MEEMEESFKEFMIKVENSDVTSVMDVNDVVS